MQLGTRWVVGAEPPSKLPDEMVTAIREVEGELAETAVDTSAWRWTLTWLERRPIVQLDDGTTLELGGGSGVVRSISE